MSMLPIQRFFEELDDLDIAAITIGLIGTVLNCILIWVIYKNRSIEKKCASIYKNIAAGDVFNCLIIPLCFVTLDSSDQFDIDSASSKDTILYLLFGATVNIPYMSLILLSVARVMIFRHQMFYSSAIRTAVVQALCLLCWIVPFGSGLGIWLCLMLAGNDDRLILTNLIKVQSVFTIILVLTTLILIGVTVSFLNQMIRSARENFEIACILDQGIASQILERELKSARRTFWLFLLSILIFSLYPFVFSVSFVVCGPHYTSTMPLCVPLERKGFSAPQSAYAYTLISLCGMSIVNCLILLRQKSFLETLKKLWICRIRILWQREEVSGTRYVAPKPVGPVQL